MKRVLVGLLVAWSLGAGCAAYAQVPAGMRPTVVYDPAGGRAQVIPAKIQNVSPADFGRVWEKALGGDVSVTDDVPGTKVGGNTDFPGVKSKRTIPWQKVAGAAAKVAGPVGTAIAVKELWDMFHCRWDGGPLPKCDEGGEQESVQADSFRGTNGNIDKCPYRSSPSEAAMVCGSNVYGGQYVSVMCYPVQGQAMPQCDYTYKYPNEGANRMNVIGIAAGPLQQVEQCPAFIDPFDPQYNIPAGSPPMPDGKCRTGRYAGTPVDTLGGKFAQYGDKDKADDIARDTVKSGGDLAPEAGPQTLSGPPTKTVGPTTTTTTGPTGTPQTTTTWTTHNVTYNQTINYYNWTTITTTNYPDGTVTEEEKPPEPEPKDECELNPERITCQEMDEPEGPDIPNEDRQVTWSPMAGWGADSGSCPDWPTVSVLGRPVHVDLHLVCTFMAGIRFAVIGIAGIIGALILIGGGKSE